MNHSFAVKPKESDLAKTRAELLDALVNGDQVQAMRLVDSAITSRWEPSFVYVYVVGHCLAEVGSLWHAGELSIAVEHRATQIALRLLARAQSAYVNGKKIGKRALITSVQGDNHIIGGLTFADLLRIDGWEVDFLGADSPIETVVEMVEKEAPDLVGLSVTIEEFVPNAATTVREIKKLQEPPIVIVGGAVANDPSLESSDFKSVNALEAVEWTRRHFNMDESSRPLEVMLSELGERIQSLRKDRGLSQQALASEAGLDRSYISAVEHGRQNVSFATLKGIADALKIGVVDLISG